VLGALARGYHVNFTYPSGTATLRVVSMTIEAGKTTTLAGLDGAGKSKIIKLLCKFQCPDNGGKTVESGTHLALYEKRGTYRKIFDTSVWSLNIEKLAKTMADDGKEVLDTRRYDIILQLSKFS
jgi:ABC-type multidrug transport system fused ATPase/permease subunit